MLASGIVDLILADAGGACPEEIPDCVGLRQSRAGGAVDRLSDVERDDIRRRPCIGHQQCGRRASRSCTRGRRRPHLGDAGDRFCAGLRRDRNYRTTETDAM
jgi:hypothetical protein